jgi:nucleotide-binding universal stress UspA family protein
MLKNILVPLDGSPLAETALPYATAIASRAGASLTLVRAAQQKWLVGDLTYDAQQQTLQQAEDYLAPFARDLAAQGFNVQTGVPYGGSAAEWIVEESEIRHVDLVVMATHDRVGPDRWVYGSVAEAVVHRSTVPVVLVRDTDAVQRFDTSQAVLIVPLDGSDLAESALQIARELAQVISARLVLVGVVPKPGQLIAGQAGVIVTYVGSEQADLEAEARAYLEANMVRLAASGACVETALRFGDAAEEIAAAAQEYAAAAVVMATHGRTGLVRSVLGSVAGGVLHHSSCPVVLIHPRQLRPAEEPVPHRAAAAPAD